MDMDHKASAVKGLEGAINVFRQDLEALGEEAFCKSFGPATRTVADIVYEVNMVNDHVGLSVRGEEVFKWPEGYIKAPEGFKDKQTVTAAFDESAQRILDTFRGYTQEELEVPFPNPDSEGTRFGQCRFVTLHLWYHSGQLNYIQTLLGDDAWHWK